MNEGFDIERELFFAMEEETNELGVPELDLDRMRRSGRRRTAVLAGGASAVVVAGVGLAFALGSGGGKGSGTVVSAGSPRAVSTSSAPVPTSAASPTASTVTAWPNGGTPPPECQSSLPSPDKRLAGPGGFQGSSGQHFIPTAPGMSGDLTVSLVPPTAPGDPVSPTFVTLPPDGRGEVVLLCPGGAVPHVLLPSNLKPVDAPLPSGGK